MISKFSKALLVIVAAVMVLSGCDSAPATPNLAPAKQKAQQCVEPTETMRSTHMSLLMHQRDETMLQGIRTQKHSLAECVNCHASPAAADGKEIHYGDKEYFCTTCHAAVGEKIDCFQCHTDQPASAKNQGYQHNIGSAEAHHFTQGVSNAVAPTSQDVQMLAQPTPATKPAGAAP